MGGATSSRKCDGERGREARVERAVHKALSEGDRSPLIMIVLISREPQLKHVVDRHAACIRQPKHFE